MKHFSYIQIHITPEGKAVYDFKHIKTKKNEKLIILGRDFDYNTLEIGDVHRLDTSKEDYKHYCIIVRLK
jgi:hypothetical protein